MAMFDIKISGNITYGMYIYNEYLHKSYKLYIRRIVLVSIKSLKTSSI